MAMKWLSVLGAAIFAVSCSADRDEVSRVQSPDARLTAVLYESSGGAPTSYSYDVEVLETGGKAVPVSRL